jgi:nucleoside-diphosphate-sugar epimerase
MKAKRGLIGYTGFVGGNLMGQAQFDARYNSKNVEELAGAELDLLVISGTPAAKWIANREPEADLNNIKRLIAAVTSVKQVGHVVHISTVDVYPVPAGVNEDSEIDATGHHAYGSNRLYLEGALREYFGDALTIIRLPGLFGPGLKKNAIYDLLNDNNIDRIHCDGVFQFYNTERLWADICRIREQGIQLINMTSGPLRIGDIARKAFGMDFDNRPDYTAPSYDFKSRHAESLGGQEGYLYTADQVLGEICAYVRCEQES